MHQRFPFKACSNKMLYYYQKQALKKQSRLFAIWTCTNGTGDLRLSVLKIFHLEKSLAGVNVILKECVSLRKHRGGGSLQMAVGVLSNLVQKNLGFWRRDWSWDATSRVWSCTPTFNNCNPQAPLPINCCQCRMARLLFHLQFQSYWYVMVWQRHSTPFFLSLVDLVERNFTYCVGQLLPRTHAGLNNSKWPLSWL